jgi:NADH-quinone oxidoreductase subunit G
MTKIIIDGVETDVPPDYTLLQACEEVGAEVPRFCFHERLSVAGNCRMCLVEVKGAPKPMPSCTVAVKELRPGPNGEPPQIFTNSPVARTAREGTMELILINHPLDCPICDQAGQCDLQDQARAYGRAEGRFTEKKHKVQPKNFGCLISAHMTRCIHCTRCVRFITEVAGVPEIGALWRGENTEIQTYLQSALTSELQGNLADLCPVGALNHKPSAYRFRPWELTKTNSIDIMDAVGSNIRVDTKGREVMRISPRVNEDINEEWLSDKSRYVVDGLKTGRLDRPYIRTGGVLRAAGWDEAFALVADKLHQADKSRIGAVVGDLVSVEEAYALKLLMQSLGVKNLDSRWNGFAPDGSQGRGSYLFNSTIAGIENADALLIVGSNPRLEAPIINLRIRKRWRKGKFPIALIGAPVDLTYPYAHLGTGPDVLRDVAGGGNDFAKVLKDAKNPLILVGQGALARPDGLAVLAEIAKIAKEAGVIADGWNGLSILHTGAAQVGALDVGFVPGEGGLNATDMLRAGKLDVLFNLGVDEADVEPGAFVIYLGTHGDRGAERADVILPGACYTEKSATYVNTEGRPQVTARASFPPGDAREDWAILRALSEVLGKTLPFNSLGTLRQKLYEDYPFLGAVGVADAAAVDLDALASASGDLQSAPFRETVVDFYLTNPQARASATMAECAAQARQTTQQAAE